MSFQLQLWFSYEPCSRLRVGSSHPKAEEKVASLGRVFCLFSIEVLVSLYDCRSLSCKNCTVEFREELEPFFGTWHLLCGCEVSSSQPFVSSHQTESGHEVAPEGH